MPLAAADDGIFHERFKRLSGAGVPAVGIVVSTSIASTAALINYVGSSGAAVFTTLVLMTGITAAIPYGFSALAQIRWRLADRRAMQTARFTRDVTVAALALVFSVLFIWYSRNTSADQSSSAGRIFHLGGSHGSLAEWMPFVLAGVALLAGLPVYRRQRAKMTPPEPVPPYG
jgi:APA family basic amino acid/polyamine antiporter